MSMAATPRVRVSVTTPSDAVTLCAVAGEVDHFSADEFRAQLLTAL
ncbi:anti-sigma factor antagonist, partial [Nocardia beijingensis]|nr:anti-sigma factor antagonist [Nocardia beijingensis]